MSIPKINIKHGWLLQRAFVHFLAQIPGKEESAKLAPNQETGKEMAKAREVFWLKESELILNAIEKVSGLEFKRVLLMSILFTDMEMLLANL